MAGSSTIRGIAAAVFLAFAGPVVAPALAQEPFIEVDPLDPEMSIAISQARESLDGALDRIFDAARRPGEAALKVAIPKTTGSGREHIWVTAVVARPDGGFAGILINEPVEVDLRQGDRIRFSRDQVTDWYCWEDELLHGGYTLRVMLDRMHPAEASEWRGRLAPLP